MLIEAPIPSWEIEEISVTFVSQFLGAFPNALSPLGALALSGTSRTLVELASLRPRRRASSGPRRSSGFAKHFYLLRFARWHPASFFERPAELVAYSPAHRGQRYPHTPLLLPQLAVAL